MGTFILWMFQRHGRTMTWGVLVVYLLLITMATIGFFVQGATVGGFVCLVLLAFGSMYVGTQRGREKIELIAKLMKAAGKGLIFCLRFRHPRLRSLQNGISERKPWMY